MLQDNNQALQSLAATLNIPLSFNADGVCDLVMNGDALITLEGDPQSTALRINAVVGVLPEADSPQALRLLLQANFNGQGTGANSLAIDHVSNEVVLGRRVDVSTLGPDGLLKPVREFARYLLYWRRNLLRQVAQASSPEPGREELMMSLSMLA
jgi:hypothetical protein